MINKEKTRVKTAQFSEGSLGDYLISQDASSGEVPLSTSVLAEAEVQPLMRFGTGGGPTQSSADPYEGGPEVGSGNEVSFWKGAFEKESGHQEEALKLAGGPGSGVAEENAKAIPSSILEQSKVVRIGGRKGIMDTQPHEDRQIPVKSIRYACQDNYVPKKMQAILAKMRSGELEDKPIAVLEVDGELHVLDGHHRAMAAKVLGRKKIPAHVYKGVDKKMEKKAFWAGFEKSSVDKKQYMSAIKNSKDGLARAEKYLRKSDSKSLLWSALRDRSRHDRGVVNGSVRDRAIKSLKPSPSGGGKKKLASAFGHAAELAGLGALAYHPAKELITGKKSSEKAKALTEVGGLGILAAPTLHSIAKGVLKKHAEAMDSAGLEAIVGSVTQKKDEHNPEMIGDHPTNDAITAGLL